MTNEKKISDVLVMIDVNRRNRIEAEIYNCKRIRINSVIATKGENFLEMMDTITIIALKNKVDTLFYADKLSNELLSMFLQYGFNETEVCGDPYNHYLYFNLNEGGGG